MLTRGVPLGDTWQVWEAPTIKSLELAQLKLADCRVSYDSSEVTVENAKEKAAEAAQVVADAAKSAASAAEVVAAADAAEELAKARKAIEEEEGEKAEMEREMERVRMAEAAKRKAELAAKKAAQKAEAERAAKEEAEAKKEEARKQAELAAQADKDASAAEKEAGVKNGSTRRRAPRRKNRSKSPAKGSGVASSAKDLDKFPPRSMLTQVDREHLLELRRSFGLGDPVRLHSPRMRALTLDVTSSLEYVRPGVIGDGTTGGASRPPHLAGDLETPVQALRPGMVAAGSAANLRRLGTPDVLLSREVELHRELKEVQDMRHKYMAGGRAALIQTQTRAHRDPNLSKLLGVHSRLPEPSPGMPHVASADGLSARTPATRHRIDPAADFYTPVPPLPPMTPVPRGGRRLAPVTTPAEALSSGYSNSRIRALPGMSADKVPQPLKLMSHSSADAMRAQIDALRSSAEEYGRHAQETRGQYTRGIGHDRVGQKMLRKSHRENIARANRAQERIDASLDRAYVNGELAEREGMQNEYRRRTVESLAASSRGPVLPVSSSEPSLVFKPQRNASSAVELREEMAPAQLAWNAGTSAVELREDVQLREEREEMAPAQLAWGVESVEAL